MSHIVGIYGTGGCGRGIMPLARFQYEEAKCVFIDDSNEEKLVNHNPVLGWRAFLDSSAGKKSVSLAIANHSIRKELAAKCAGSGIPLIEVRANTVIEMDDVQIGEGSCLSPFVTMTSNIQIGKCFHANLYAYIEHDCTIGDFVTLAPRASLNGNVTVEDGAYIGANAVVKQGLTIGKGAIVGMGAVVTRNVAPGEVVVGNPARPLRK